MRTFRIAASLSAVVALQLALVAPATSADEIDASLTTAFVGQTPSLAWQERMPSATRIGSFLGAAQNLASGGFPEYRTASIVGGGAFADAPGFQGKVNGFWYDAALKNGSVSAAVNIAAFDSVAQATDAVALDAKASKVSAQSGGTQDGLQLWRGTAATDDWYDQFAWVVTAEPAPMVVRVICSVSGPAPLRKRCSASAADQLALEIAGPRPLGSQLPPGVVQDLPVSTPGLSAVLAVELTSAVAWGGLEPTPQLRKALAVGNSTSMQFAPPRVTPVAVSALVTELPNPASARKFVTQICNDVQEGSTCKVTTVKSSAAGIATFGQLATTTSKGKVISIAIQGTGAGALIFIDCRNLRAFDAPLSRTDAAFCRSSVPTLFDALLQRQQG